MADTSSDLEILCDVERQVDSGLESEVVQEQTRQRRVRVQYLLNRTFNLTEEFQNWWNEEGSVGWELNNHYTSSSGQAIDYYRYF